MTQCEAYSGCLRLSGKRLYGLYASDARGYEVVQVIGGEDGAHCDLVGVEAGGEIVRPGSREENDEFKTARDCKQNTWVSSGSNTKPKTKKSEGTKE